MPYLLASLLVSALIGGSAMLATDALVSDLDTDTDAQASLSTEASGDALTGGSADEEASVSVEDGVLSAEARAEAEAEAEDSSFDFDLLSELGLEL